MSKIVVIAVQVSVSLKITKYFSGGIMYYITFAFQVSLLKWSSSNPPLFRILFPNLGLLFAVRNDKLQSGRCYVLFLVDICMWTTRPLKGTFHYNLQHWQKAISFTKFDFTFKEILKSLMELSASLDTYRPNSQKLFRNSSGNSKTELINDGRVIMPLTRVGLR